MNKYEFTGETKEIGVCIKITLRRIKAVVDFGDVKAGELGGWIEKEENLSHEGNAWVSGDAIVYGDAWVSGNAIVCDNAIVYGDAWVSGDARVSGNAWVCDNARVSGNAWVCDNAIVYGDARVYGDAGVCENADIYDTVHVLVIGPIGSMNDFTTFCRDRNNEIMVKCGCFSGKTDSFLEKVHQTHGDNKYALVYRAAVETAKLQIGLSGESREEDRK